MSVNPQKAINSARRRHPQLTTAVLDDQSLVDDWNQAVQEVYSDILEVSDEALASYLAAIAFAGADGSVVDLNPTEGELVRVVAMDAGTGAGGTAPFRKVNLESFHRRDSLVREYADQTTRPVGFITWSASLGRWQLHEVTNWTAVLGVRIFGPVIPADVTSATLGTNQTAIPDVAFGPLAEKMALLLGQRAGLSEGWFQTQGGIYTRALNAVTKRFGGPHVTPESAPPSAVAAKG